MRKIIFLFFVFNLFIFERVHAQSACPFIDAGIDTTVNCRACITLNAFAIPTYQSTTYTVSQITYAPPFPFSFGTPILVNIDDHWSNVLNLPFTFCFFGNSYTSLIAGSNGVVSFNTGSANAYNTYPISAAIPSTTPADLLNSIMGPWHDIDPSISGQMYYQVAGVAPCRMIVFSWDSVAMFSTGCNNLLASQQIVLYENSNIIDVYIGNKPLCPAWNAGAAIEGIQDASGTIAYVVPGRNFPTQWTASNDAWRFAPDGPPNYSVNWFNSTGLIASGSTVTVCPDSSSDYVAVATYALCGAASASVSDSVHITVLYPVDSVSTDTILCIGQGIQISGFATGGTGHYTYEWDNGVNQQSQFVMPTLPSSYTVIAYDDSLCASLPLTVNVDVYPPLSLAISHPVTICQGDTTGIFINESGGNGGPYYTAWSTGDINIDSLFVAPLHDIVYSVVLTDGCGTPSDSAAEQVKVNKTPVVDFNPHFYDGCQPLPVQFTDATTNGVPNSIYTWNFGDGVIDDSYQNPLHVYVKNGLFNVSLDVRTPEGCESSDTLFNVIRVYRTPVSSFVYSPEQLTDLFPNVWFQDRSISAVIWEWNFGDGIGTSTEPSPFYHYEKSGLYDVQLIVTSPEGCLDTLVEKLLIDGDFTMYIPKAFTPNGDGVNDNFLPMGYGITGFNMDIFDRWGTVVFHSDNTNEPWNGKMQSNGGMCTQDVYIYKVIAFDSKNSKHEFVGPVTLVY